MLKSWNEAFCHKAPRIFSRISPAFLPHFSRIFSRIFPRIFPRIFSRIFHRIFSRISPAFLPHFLPHFSNRVSLYWFWTRVVHPGGGMGGGQFHSMLKFWKKKKVQGCIYIFVFAIDVLGIGLIVNSILENFRWWSKIKSVSNVKSFIFTWASIIYLLTSKKSTGSWQTVTQPKQLKLPKITQKKFNKI